MVKVSIDITLSKILAYVVFIVGSVYSFVFVDPTVFMASMAAASSIITLKTYVDGQTKRKKMEFPEENDI